MYRRPERAAVLAAGPMGTSDHGTPRETSPVTSFPFASKTYSLTLRCFDNAAASRRNSAGVESCVSASAATTLRPTANASAYFRNAPSERPFRTVTTATAVRAATAAKARPSHHRIPKNWRGTRTLPALWLTLGSLSFSGRLKISCASRFLRNRDPAPKATYRSRGTPRTRRRRSMASKLKIKVNGLVHNVTASLDTPLLYVLHNELHLHGPRFGCGLAQCGACSVLLDGKEIRSCVTPVAAVSGKAITTLEGLPAMWAQERGTAAASPALHPLQQAWIDVQVPHCGYCQNGMMIQAADLLSTTKNPTEDQIRTAMNGHLCRCGTYPRILTAIKQAAAVMAKGGK